MCYGRYLRGCPDDRILAQHIRDLILHIVTEHTTPNWIVVQVRIAVVLLKYPGG